VCGKILATEMSGKPHIHGEIYSADRYKIPSDDHWEIVGKSQEERQKYLNIHQQLNLDRKAIWGVTTTLNYKNGGYATVIKLRIPGTSKTEAVKMAETEAIRRYPLLVIRKSKAEVLEK
jgi:hypothetical protein